MEEDQKFIEDVVKAIVENPSDVKTERTIDERGVLIKLYVNPADMGKIIGKEGKTAKAIRTLLRVFGAKNNARLNLKIVEPEGSERPGHDDDDSSNDDILDDVPSDVLA
ncbi:MAG: KH domain-containing protein [Candidatus Berkelbacteria bacterium]|nr:KH domain-containing protein [Candidatus Berkelbacteria bacterium]